MTPPEPDDHASDEEKHRAAARRLFGVDLVGNLDGEIERNEDIIYDTRNAYGANQTPTTPEDARLRAVFRTMTGEQRDACLELVQEMGRSMLYSFASP